MLVYFIELLVIVIAAVFLYAFPGERGKRIYLAVVFLVLWLVSGLRDVSVGTDTFAYYKGFETIAHSDSLSDAFKNVSVTAPIYVVYNWILSHLFGANYQIALLFNAAVICACVAYLTYRLSSNVAFSAFTFFAMAIYFQSMNGMREYVAVSLASLAYYQFAMHGLRSWSGWVAFICAVGIHMTAIAVLLPLGALLYLQRCADEKRGVIKLVIAIVICALLMELFVGLFTLVVPYYGIYIGTEKYDILRPDASGRIVVLYLLLLIPAICAFVNLRRSEQGAQQCLKNAFPMIICALVLGLMFARNSLMNRLIWYYLLSFVWFIPTAISRCSERQRPLLLFLLSAGLVVWCCLQLLENKSDVVPYAFFF